MDVLFPYFITYLIKYSELFSGFRNELQKFINKLAVSKREKGVAKFLDTLLNCAFCQGWWIGLFMWWDLWFAVATALIGLFADLVYDILTFIKYKLENEQ